MILSSTVSVIFSLILGHPERVPRDANRVSEGKDPTVRPAADTAQKVRSPHGIWKQHGIRIRHEIRILHGIRIRHGICSGACLVAPFVH